MRDFPARPFQQQIRPAAMADAPLISIITINRDNAAGLYRTLRSAERLNRACELVVVDGDSSDGSADIARDFSHVVDTFIAEPDTGIYDAMNKGAQAAAGEWVIFMNSGDAFDAPEVLDDLKLEGADIVYGEARAAQAGHVREYAPALWKGMAFCHQAALTRREWLEKFPFDESRRVIADWEFFVKCDRAGAKMRKADRVIASVDDTGVSYGDSARLAAERLPVALRHYGWKTPQLIPYYLKLMAPSGERAA